VWLLQVMSRLVARLLAWQEDTADPWLCSPHSVLEAGSCRPLDN
jgi:hypothetical protein